ncbi:hypothetical protein DLM_1749 [Aquitalea magnusonii]|uniref:Nucleotide pyrophosphatase n=1 Tax=Aquitalea magnusonii TaxID=332411 RepID=A0A3G9GD35_9NEIS|nr:alkaline phosphatase family protein [Aquitalea magnusonii]BBF85365.1 hypothetical protein DLM_1749 [Aquitalea magnusonii]
MRSKVILVVVDGLGWQVGHDGMGYLQAMCEAGQASLHQLRCELPSLSRPLYECILSGAAPIASGVVHNDVVRLSTAQSIFSLAHAAGLRTAAAAYHWISELYNRAPYDAVRDRLTDDDSLPIQHGLFYHVDHYPDDHLYIDAELLRRRHKPDFLLIHPMGVDDAGHRFGGDSMQYRNAARANDKLLSHYLPQWLAEDYQVLITSDHGMNADHSHGGILPEERLVPLYLLGSRFNHASTARVRQLELCGLMASLLGIAHSKPDNRAVLNPPH